MRFDPQLVEIRSPLKFLDYKLEEFLEVLKVSGLAQKSVASKTEIWEVGIILAALSCVFMF